MISFDDGGGSYGGSSAADLSPIYRTLQILNTNTESMESELNNIWNFVSTLSFTTISYSTPYLESYRSENELYMYNISGSLGTLTDDFQVINGYYSIVSKTYESLYKRLCFVDSFVANSIDTFTLSMTGNNLSNNTFSYGSCEFNFTNINNNTFDANLTLTVNNSLKHNEFLRGVSGYAFTAFENTFSGLMSYIMNGSFINSNVYSSIKTLSNIAVYFNSNSMSSIRNMILSQEVIYSNSFYNLTNVYINCLDVSNNTFNSVGNVYITGENITGNSMFNVRNINIIGTTISANNFNSINTGRNKIYYINALKMYENSLYYANSISIRCDTFEKNRFNDNGVLRIYNYSSCVKSCTFNNMDIIIFETGRLSNCSFNMNYTLDLNNIYDASNLTISKHTLVKVPFLNSNSWIIDGQYVQYIDIGSVDSTCWYGTMLAIDSSMGLYNMPSARIFIGGSPASLFTK